MERGRCADVGDKKKILRTGEAAFPGPCSGRRRVTRSGAAVATPVVERTWDRRLPGTDPVGCRRLAGPVTALRVVSC